MEGFHDPKAKLGQSILALILEARAFALKIAACKKPSTAPSQKSSATTFAV